MMTTPNNASAPRLARWKVVLFSLVLAAAVYAVLELMAVWYLKQTRGYDGKHLYQYVFDPYKNILPTPNYVDTRGIRHNAEGFRRSTEVTREKPPGTYRIFLMGGSTAYGLGGLWPHIQKQFAVIDNSQTIDAYLERLLQDSLPGRKVEVINAAITSTWTHHSLIYLNQTILNYHPDMVLFLDGFNDYYYTDPNHDQFASYSYNLESRVIMGPPTLGSLLYANGWWLFRKSALAHVVGRGLRLVKLAIQGRPKPEPLNVPAELAGLQQVFPHSALKMHRRSALILQDEGVVPVLMLQPMLILERQKPKPEMEQRLFDFNVSSYPPNWEAFSLAARDSVVRYERAMAQEVGAMYLDLTDLYHNVPEQIYTDYCHLTPLGNRLLAERVAQNILPVIRSKGVPPSTAASR